MFHGAGVCRVDRFDTRSFARSKTFAARLNLRSFARSNAFGWRHVALALVTTACAHLPSQPRVQPVYWGFTGPWDPRSDASVEEHGPSLARVITGWIALDTTSFRPVQAYPDSMGKQPVVAPRAMALAAPKKLDPTMRPRATSSAHSTGALSHERRRTETTTNRMFFMVSV